MKLNLSPALSVTLALCVCGAQAARPAPKAPKVQTPAQVLEAAAQKIDADDLLDHIKMLASDEFEGRAPGSHGEALMVDYLQEQLKKMILVRCDEAQWRFLGLSLAGYNALISLAMAVVALWGVLAKRPQSQA